MLYKNEYCVKSCLEYSQCKLVDPEKRRGLAMSELEALGLDGSNGIIVTLRAIEACIENRQTASEAKNNV